MGHLTGLVALHLKSPRLLVPDSRHQASSMAIKEPDVSAPPLETPTFALVFQRRMHGVAALGKRGARGAAQARR